MKPVPGMTERMAEAYWNAYRDGVLKAGLREYPTWAESTDPVKEETMRCMRHAVEVLLEAERYDSDVRGHVISPNDFPNPPQPRTLKRIANDDAALTSQKIARLDG